MRKSRGIRLVVLLLIISFILFGCRREERPNPAPEDNTEKIPTVLTDMDESIHSIIEDIEGITEVLEIKPEDIRPQETQQEESSESAGGQGEQEQGQGGQEGQQEEGQKSSPSGPQLSLEEQMGKVQREKQAQVLEKWKSAQEELMSLHEFWNRYKATALKNGADTEKVEKIERALISITTSLDQENMNQVLIASNDVILAISDFMDLYKGNLHGILGKIEYRIRQSYMEAMNDNWLRAREEIQQTDSLVTSLQSRGDIDEEDQPLMDRLIHSVEDVKNVMSEENMALLEVKRDIALDNIDTVKEELN